MTLQEVCELSWEKCYPAGAGKPAIPKESFVRRAYSEFAYQSLLMAWKEGSEDYYEVPSYLLREVEKDVVDDEIDISDLQYFKSLPMGVWLQGVSGDTGCGCEYVRTSFNLSKLLCGDDSLPDSTRTYFPLGKKLVFPQGTHKKKLILTYADMGDTLNGDVEIDEAIGAIVMDKLDAIYSGKVPPTDMTNNGNPNV